jgi:hypothetical protein
MNLNTDVEGNAKVMAIAVMENPINAGRIPNDGISQLPATTTGQVSTRNTEAR